MRTIPAIRVFAVCLAAIATALLFLDDQEHIVSEWTHTLRNASLNRLNVRVKQDSVMEKVQDEAYDEEQEQQEWLAKAQASSRECPYYTQYDDCHGPRLKRVQADIASSVPTRSFENIQNISILFTGNSHIRQLVNVFLCVVGGNREYPTDILYLTHRNSGLSIIHLPRNITVYHSTNNPYLYRHDWKQQHAKMFNKTIDSFDVIVNGNFNKFNEMHPEKYGHIKTDPPALTDFEPYEGLFLFSPGMLVPPRLPNLTGTHLYHRILNTTRAYDIVGYCGYQKKNMDCLNGPEVHLCVPGPLDVVVWELLETLDYELDTIK